MRATIAIFGLFLILAGMGTASAAEKSDKKATSVEAPRAVASTSGPSNPWAFGVADTGYLTNGQSLSALFATNRDWVQVLLTVPNVKGSFEFSTGAVYKFTVYGTRATGFHVGPGATLGAVNAANVGNLNSTGTSKFGFAIFGAAGGHFALFDRLLLAVDAGPIFSVIDGDFNFRMRPFGEILGLSMHYLF